MYLHWFDSKNLQGGKVYFKARRYHFSKVIPIKVIYLFF